MKQLLKDIIIDQKSFLPSKKTIIRSFSEKYLNNEEIIIISGVRRCGKSVLLQQIRDRLPQKDYFFNFDDDRLGNFTIENFQQLYEVFIELYGEQNYFYFDEIQNRREISVPESCYSQPRILFLKYLHRTLHLFLTRGSEILLLQQNPFSTI